MGTKESMFPVAKKNDNKKQTKKGKQVQAKS